MRNCNSIVEKVNCRSFTALDLGLDVHRHSGLTILLCSNTHNITGCYRNYIVRETSELVVSMQMWCMFQRGACRCCFTYVWRLGKKHGKPCIYMDGYEWEKHSLSNMELSVWDFREFTCLCLDLSSLEFTEMICMIAFCLKSSTMSATKPTFGQLNELLRERLLALIVRMKFHEC